MVVHWWIWVGFSGLVVALLAADLLFFHRGEHETTTREAAWAVALWVAVALAFGGVVWIWQGPTTGAEYAAGYLIEWALSVDNMFVFAVIFTYFALPARLQHGVLFWGVLGALVFRGVFIAAGAALLARFGWMIFVFGGFLVLTGLRMLRTGNEEIHPERHPVLRVVRRLVPMTSDYRGSRFFVREDGRRMATPLLAVLAAVESTDVIFAVDSIPAIFGVTREPFMVFSSNAFAILGLRSVYFLLAGMIRRFSHLKVGLSAVLVFVGAKMLLSEIVHVPVGVSLAVIAATLGVSVLASLGVERRQSRVNTSSDD